MIFTKEELQEIQALKSFLQQNKLTFDQFIRVNNFLLDLNKEKPTNMSLFINAYQQGMFKGIGFY